MAAPPSTDSSIHSIPNYVTALDHVVAEADTDLPIEAADDDLESLLQKLGQLAGVFRGDDIHSLLRQGESALLAGALGRSLVESAVAEHWYSSRKADKPRTATLALERENIANSIHQSGLTVPNIARWNNPLTDKRYATAASGPALPNIQSALSSKAPSTVEAITSLPAPLTDVLSMCSHVNHAATWLTVTPQPSEIGVNPTAIFAAVLAQASGLSLASLRGFNYRPVVLELVASATAKHDFDVKPRLGREKLVEDMLPSRPARSTPTWDSDGSPSAFLDFQLLELRKKAERVWHLVNNAPNPFSGPSNTTNLTSALPYLTARALLMVTIRSTYGDCSPLMAPTGARMLLEQGSELSWRSADSSDEELLSRYVAVMNDATDRKKALEQRLLTRTSSTKAVEELLYPLGRKGHAVDTRRTPANEAPSRPPSPSVHLNALELGLSEPSWGALAYKLLTQAAHATPLGLLHSVARVDPETGNAALSHEMTALSIDTACIGAALTFRSLAPLITHQAGLPSPREWLGELFEAVRDVHRDSQMLHLLG